MHEFPHRLDGVHAVLLYEPESTPMDLRFRVFGTDVRVHPFFWLMSAVLGFQASINHPVLAGNGMADLALWIACLFFSILLHELGHVWMGRLFGSEGCILLYGMGGLAVGSNNLSARGQRILVSFAGPLIQLVLWAVLVGIIWATCIPPDVDRSRVLGLIIEAPRAVMKLLIPGNPAVALLLGDLLVINFLWPVFNLFPIWPLDGGMITRELCTGMSESRGLIVSLWISLIVAATFAMNALVVEYQKKGFVPYFDSIGGWPMAILFAYLAAGSFQAIQIVNSQRRSYDDDLPWER
jgi:Zn-dependent protease